MQIKSTKEYFHLAYDSYGENIHAACALYHIPQSAGLNILFNNDYIIPALIERKILAVEANKHKANKAYKGTRDSFAKPRKVIDNMHKL